MVDRRHLRGYWIHKSGMTIKKRTGGVWSVQSESKRKKSYSVTLTSTPISCSCKDWLDRRRHCKHIYAVIERLRSKGVGPYDIPKMQVPSLKPQLPPWMSSDDEGEAA
jgi:hypothetical protein